MRFEHSKLRLTKIWRSRSHETEATPAGFLLYKLSLHQLKYLRHAGVSRDFLFFSSTAGASQDVSYRHDQRLGQRVLTYSNPILMSQEFQKVCNTDVLRSIFWIDTISFSLSIFLSLLCHFVFKPVSVFLSLSHIIWFTTNANNSLLRLVLWSKLSLIRTSLFPKDLVRISNPNIWI